MPPAPFRRYLPLVAALLAAGCAPAAASGVEWSGTTDLASGRGERGPWQQSQSRYDHVDDPAVAIGANGDAVVAWVDQARRDVLFQRVGHDGTRHPRDPVNVSRSPSTFSWLPRMAAAGDRIFVLWQEIIFSGGSHGGDILFARSEDGGRTFSTPLNLSGSAGGDGKGRINREVWDNGSMDLTLGPGGALYAAWTEYDGLLWFSRSDDGGQRFSSPRQLAGSPDEPARGPSLAAGPDGALYLAWTVGEHSGADIRVARSMDRGATFDGPRIVAPGRDYSDAPRIAVDRTGVLHLVYAESAGGPFDRFHIRYTRSSDGGQRFEAPRDISRPAARSVDSTAYPAMVVDAAGNLYVAWEHYAHHRARPRGLEFTVSRDGGRSFGDPRSVPGSSDPDGGTNGSHQGLLMQKLAVGATGEVAVVNSSLQTGKRSRVWLMRGRLHPR